MAVVPAAVGVVEPDDGVVLGRDGQGADGACDGKAGGRRTGRGAGPGTSRGAQSAARSVPRSGQVRPRPTTAVDRPSLRVLPARGAGPARRRPAARSAGARSV